ncbi:MAG: hypothetical protein P8M34_04930 [Saprospiraceae bacterium]|nr:hypothetical protein [Saprospiraceae bacterium]
MGDILVFPNNSFLKYLFVLSMNEESDKSEELELSDSLNYIMSEMVLDMSVWIDQKTKKLKE